MTALTMVQNATSRLGLSVPGAIFSSTDTQVVQFRNLMNQEGKDLAKGAATDHPWTKLISEQTFSTTAAAVQTGAVPTDFGWYINDTAWNRTTEIKLDGPITAEDWQRYQAVGAITLPNAVFRFRGGDVLIYPDPTASQTVAFEYVSSYWAETSAGAGASLAAMTSDTDVAILDEELITLGIIWRFLQAKGLDYAEAFRTYQLEVNKAIGRDGGRYKYNLAGHSFPRYQGNIPEGSWS